MQPDGLDTLSEKMLGAHLVLVPHFLFLYSYIKSYSPGKSTVIENFPIAIQFLGAYVIVMGVSNEASLWTCSSWIYKKSHLRAWMLKFW